MEVQNKKARSFGSVLVSIERRFGLGSEPAVIWAVLNRSIIVVFGVSSGYPFQEHQRLLRGVVRTFGGLQAIALQCRNS